MGEVRRVCIWEVVCSIDLRQRGREFIMRSVFSFNHKVMLKVAGREKERWLNTESIEKFPCEDLRTIDQLWVKYSNGHFGFSVQKRIYQSLGGTSKYNYKLLEAFGDRVGWRKNNAWL